jgi:hypothetical protein
MGAAARMALVGTETVVGGGGELCAAFGAVKRITAWKWTSPRSCYSETLAKATPRSTARREAL